MKRKLKKFITFFVLSIYILSISPSYALAKVGKKNGNSNNTTVNAIKKLVEKPANLNKNNSPKQTTSKQIEIKTFEQFKSPAKGDMIAVVKTKIGTVKIKLLPQYAPKIVEIFKNRINSGYYNGLNFNRVVRDSIIQGGLLLKNDLSGDTSQSNVVIDEFNPDIRNFRGAVSVTNTSIDKDGGQFTIVQTKPESIDKDKNTLNYMVSSKENQFPKYVINEYKKEGGAPWLDFHNIVFGQVIQGMNVVDKISQVEVDENNKPKKEIKIIKIELVTY